MAKKKLLSVAKQLAAFPDLRQIPFHSDKDVEAVSQAGHRLEDLCKQLVIEEGLVMTEFEFFREGNDRGATFTAGASINLDPMDPGAHVNVTRGFSVDLPATNVELIAVIHTRLRAQLQKLSAIVASFNRDLIIMSLRRESAEGDKPTVEPTDAH